MKRRWPVVVAAAAAALLLAAAALFYALAYWPLRDPHPIPTIGRGTLAVREATIYVSPDLPPLEHATLVASDGVIVALGHDVPIPADARVLHCEHCAVTAGFWNTHVHFTEAKWRFADWTAASTLNAQLEDMLTSRGFTTVVDTGLNLRDTVPLRRRVETGELLGPKIYTAGAAQYPPNGIPFYVRESMPGWLQHLMPQPSSPAQASRLAKRNIEEGADILKLFTGAYVTRQTILPMPEENARAAVAVAHGYGQQVFSHPSNLAGVLVAVHSGADVLAHAPDDSAGIDDGVLQSIIDRHISMIPTLKMFASTVTTNPAYLLPIYDEVKRFHDMGGDLMFGTDVGYMRDYTTEGEFVALRQAGLTAMDVLRMLTTAPALRFNEPTRGSVQVGGAADLVVLRDDPVRDPSAYSRVDYTIRDGRILHDRR